MDRPAGVSTPEEVVELARSAREASRFLSTLHESVRNGVLTTLADLIDARRAEILAANALDMAEARAAGLSDAKLLRLELTDNSLAQMADGLRQVATLPEPIGKVTDERTVPSGLLVQRVRVPLGVIAMIYEARPGVTIDAFSLCFKAGNACILKGGREASVSNACLASLACEALAAHNVPERAITLLTTSDRDLVRVLLEQDQSIDLVIPRGSTELISFVRQHSKIPTVQHDRGVCHIFVDASAEIDKAIEICVNAKTSSPAACNAVECVLVHKEIADRFVPAMVQRFIAEGVEVRGGPIVRAIGGPGVVGAAPEDPHTHENGDWGREFLGPIVAMRVVPSLEDAADHIATFGSNHTEAIITTDPQSAERFIALVASSCVLVNASTRFNDGYQLGLGAEIGISTSKLHAFGPMGLEELTTQRWVVRGSGQTR